MKKNRLLFETFSLILAIVLLMGCAAQPTAAPQPTGPVKVQYWSNGWFAQSIDARKAIVDKFNQEHKGSIEVEYISASPAKSWRSATGLPTSPSPCRGSAPPRSRCSAPKS